MNGPQRLLDQPGPSARLLRAAHIHVPSERARRRALLAAGTAAATLAASGSSAAVAGGALLKSALVWLGVGALSGTVIAVVAIGGAPRKSLLEQQSGAPAAANASGVLGPARSVGARAASPPDLERVDPTPSEWSAAPPPRGIASAREPAPRDVPALDSGRAAASVPSVLRFASSESPSPNLFDELRLIDGARNAAAAHDARAALSILDHYDHAYPRGQFQPESLALRIETVARVGDLAQARALAARFRRDYPQHPLLGRVRAALGD